MSEYNWGKKIKRMRKIAGLKQAEVAKKLGITQSSLSLYEANHRPIPAITLSKIVSICGHKIEVTYVETEAINVPIQRKV